MTEKDYNSQQRESKTMKKQKNVQKAEQKVNVVETKKQNEETAKEQVVESKTEEKKQVEKKKVEHVKKDEAVVNGVSLPISTKDSVEICRFIKGKKINKAIEDLEEVLRFKKAIPMKGEIPHRRGKKMMSGRYPIKPVSYFIKMLKNLNANSNMNGIEEPIISEAVPNKASRPYGRFGAVKRKRTHVLIKAIEKNKLKNKRKKMKKGGKK